MRILAIDNDLIAGMSGGDMHAIKAAQHWAEENDVFFLSSKYGCSYIENTLCKPIVCEIPLHLDQRLNIYATLSNILIHILRVLAALFICLRIRHPIKVIVSSSHYPPDVIPAVLYRLMNPKAKIVVIMHGFFPEIPHKKLLLRIPSLLYNYFGLVILRRVADLIFVFNKHTGNLLVNADVDHRKVSLTSNGVDVTDLTMEDDGKLFDACFLGRLVENKGIPDLVKVWKLVCRVRKNAKLAVMGSGPLTELLIELIRRNDLVDNIIPLGLVPGDRKFGVLQRSKVFVFPSHLEGWAIAIAEAMACGLPVVAYDLPIYREVFEDKLITVPLGNVEAMAEKVIFLLENPSVAKEIGEAGREFVRRYDWSIVAERELSAIESLCNQKTR